MASWVPMKAEHRAFLASERWAEMLRQELLPWIVAAGPLGDHILEIGPGPGLTTDLLRTLARAVTAVELDPALAQVLRRRLAGTNVEVVEGDAGQPRFARGSFSAVACFHVLHHVPSREQQDALLVEVARVLRPGGVFLCVDAPDIDLLRQAHIAQRETFVPIDPATIAERMQRAGFRSVALQRQPYQLLVHAKLG